MTDARVDALEKEVARLTRINQVLMDRVERSMDIQGDAFGIFQTAVLLEDKVRERTLALEEVLEELGNAQRFLHEAIETIDEGFALFDKTDKLVLCNERFRHVWGNAAQLGTTFEQMARSLVATNMLPEALEDPESWIAERVDRHRHPREPVVIHTGDGRWLQVSERPTADGGIVSLYTDITTIKTLESKRRERELAEKSLLLQSSIDNLSQGVSVVDHAGRMLAWNSRFLELLDLPPEAVKIGMPLKSLQIQAGIATDAPALAEHVTPLGRVLDIRRNAMPGGGHVSTYTDITLARAKEDQLKNAVDSLTSANTELERFAYVASHDLREPLRTIVSFTQLLQRCFPQEDQAKEYMDLIIRAGARMNALIAGLLDYSRVSGQSSPFVPCDLNAIGRAVLDNLHGSIEQSTAEIQLAPLPQVIADPVQMVQLLQNLIGNAIKYRHPDHPPRIQVSALSDDKEVRISVSDNGIGIDDGGHDIYEIFRRLHHNSAYPGAGIGLAVCRRIVQHHGGKLWHEPSEDGGTTFHFTLKRHI